jgi:phage terminase large subunit
MVTVSTAIEVARRKALRQMQDETEPGQLRTLSADLFQTIKFEYQQVGRIRFPDPHYQRNPVGFFREVLGVEPWKRQRQILEAVRDHPRVACVSGHKVGKSTTAAGLSLWFYCSFVDARAIMTSVTARQVDQILWRELRMLRARSGRCTDCKRKDPEGLLIPRPCEHSAVIEGEQGELARTGLKSADFREVVGFTAREAEAVAGISGKNLIYIIDESSGVGDEIFEAIEGNRAGGARVLLLGNGTRNEGEFYEAFNSKARLYFTMRISSEETPNAVEGREVIPGLATREWIEEKKIEWGEDSPLYRVRVKGEHAIGEDAKIFSVHTISSGEARWQDTPEAGRLYIGLDPAGESGTGDDSAFSARRGLKQLLLRTMRGLNDDAHLVQLLALISELRLPRETPVVVLDREGKIGSSLHGKLRAFLDNTIEAPPFELVSVRASDRAVRQPHIYDRVRDELCANMYQWFRDGGAIVSDTKLAKELHAPEWKQGVNGKLKATPKEVLKKMLGRSPDRFDALALSVWEPLSLQDAEAPGVAQTVAATDPGAYAERTVDPYAALETWGHSSS